jgi:hypothetical protein
MGHFAKIEGGIVTHVTVSRDEDDDRELEISAQTGDMYRRTSYNTRGGVHYGPDGQPSADQSKAFRYNYAALGWSFDPDFGPDGAFIPPQPYPSWSLNPATALWDAPVPMPDDGGRYIWDEGSGSWIALPPLSAN